MSDSQKPRLPIILMISLVLNGLLIGLLIGGGLSKRSHTPPQMGAERALARGLERAAPEAQQTEIRQALRRAFAASRTERQILRRARQDLRRAVVADPYNGDAVDAALKAVQEAETQARAKLQTEVARQLGRLTPEQREMIMRDVGRKRARRHDRGMRREGRPEHPPGPPQE